MKNTTRKLKPKEIVSWVKANFDVKERRGGTELRINNPFQERETGTRDTKFHLNISVTKQSVHDWRPNHQGHDGSFIKFVMDYLECTGREAIRAIKSVKSSDIYLDEEEDYKAPMVEAQQLELPSPSWNFDDGPEKLRSAALKYLNSRCLSKEECDDWGLMYGVGTVIFPYIEYGEVVYWQSRSIADKVFEFPPEEVGVGKSQFFWGWHRLEPKEDIMITESLFGGASYGEGGLASGGAGLSDEQVSRLDGVSFSRLILGPDNDDAGIASLVSDYEKCKHVEDLWYILPPKIPMKGDKLTKDWNEIDQLCTFHPKLASKYLGEEAVRLGHKFVKHYVTTNAKKFTFSEYFKFKSKTIKTKKDKYSKMLEKADQ